MSRRKKVSRAGKPSTPHTVLTARDVSTLEVIDRRLQRACDLMTCLDYCQDAELDLGALAIAARDLLDTVRADLTPLRSEAVRL